MRRKECTYERRKMLWFFFIGAFRCTWLVIARTNRPSDAFKRKEKFCAVDKSLRAMIQFYCDSKWLRSAFSAIIYCYLGALHVKNKKKSASPKHTGQNQLEKIKRLMPFRLFCAACERIEKRKIANLEVLEVVRSFFLFQIRCECVS